MRGTDLSRKHEARERVVVLLYEAESRGMSPIDLLAQLPVAPEPYAVVLIQGIVGQRAFLDEMISHYAKGWTIERMPMIDRTVLRLGIYELAVMSNVPRAAVISEAVELASQYSTDTSARFVNGMMARIGGIVRDDDDAIVVELPEPASIAPTPKAPEPEAVRKSSTVVRSGGFESYFVERDQRREAEAEAAIALAMAEAEAAAKLAELDLDLDSDLDDDDDLEQSMLDDLAVLDDANLDDTVLGDAEVIAYEPAERPAIVTEVTEEELRSAREEGTAPQRDDNADDDDFDLEFL